MSQSISLMNEQVIKNHTEFVYSVAFSPDGRLIASGSGDKSVRISEVSTGHLVYLLSSIAPIRSVSWSPDGRKLLAVATDGHVYEAVRPLPGVSELWSHSTVYKHRSYLYSCAFNPKDHSVVLACDDKRIVFLQSVGGYAHMRTIAGLDDSVLRVAFSPNGLLLALGLSNGSVVVIYKRSSGEWEMVGGCKFHKRGVWALSFNAIGSHLLIGSEDSTASVWRVPPVGDEWSAAPEVLYQGHSKYIYGAVFSADGKYAITASTDSAVHLWRISDGQLITQTSSVERIQSLAFHAPTGVLAAGVYNTGIQLWRLFGVSAMAPAAPTSPTSPMSNGAVARPAPATQPFYGTAAAGYTGRPAVVGAPGVAPASSSSEALPTAANAPPPFVNAREALRDAQSELDGVLEAIEAAERTQSPSTSTGEGSDGAAPDHAKALTELSEKAAELEKAVAKHRDFLSGLESALASSGLSTLRGPMLWQFMHDVGLRRVQTRLRALNGHDLRLLNVQELEFRGIAFVDAAELQLRGFLAENGLAEGPHFAPVPSTSSVLAWTAEQVAAWLTEQGAPFEALATAGWTGPALMSLSTARVNAVSRGAVQAKDIRKRIKETVISKDSGAAEWVSRWTGLLPIADELI